MKTLTAAQLTAKLDRTAADRAARALARVDIARHLGLCPFSAEVKRLAAAAARADKRT